MKSYIPLRDKAIFLRKEGASYGEIQQELGVSRSTLSKWLKKIPLAPSHKEKLEDRVKNKMAKGRLRAMVVNKSKRVFKEKTIYETAEKQFEYLLKDPYFVVGISLYLAKGSKKDGRFGLMSADKSLINLMTKWLITYTKVDKNLIKYDKYNGYSRISVGNIDTFRLVMAWQKLLIQYYSNVLKNE